MSDPAEKQPDPNQNGVARTEPASASASAPARPSTGSGAEKRKFARTELSILVQYRFNSLEEFLAEYSVNISVGGMFICTQKPRPEGSMIYLQFALRNGHKLIEGLGRVVRVNGPNSEEPGMGVEFVNLDEESANLIEEIVQSNVAKQPPRS
jgi:uncharacterized protein (TIGR02266 family)